MPVTRLFEHANDARPIVAGTTIFKEGDPGDHMYAVVDGQVDIFIGGRLFESVTEGGIFGEMALIEGECRTATAVAKTDARVVRVDERRFLFLIQQTPNFALHVMRVLSDRLRRMDERVARPTKA